MTGKLLVTGASGQLGAAVLHHLIDSYKVPASTIVAGSRDVAKLSDLASRGVETREVDFNDAGTLASAFAGVDRVIIISTDALDGEGTRLRQHLAAVAAAKSAGVGRIFYTSMPNPADSKVTFAPDHLKTEAAIKPFEKWAVFLHPSQRALVERDYSGPVRIVGSAGTGKTVVALHRHREGNRGGRCSTRFRQRDLYADRPGGLHHRRDRRDGCKGNRQAAHRRPPQ